VGPDCMAGFYCTSLSYSVQPDLDPSVAKNFGPCQPGHYCPTGTNNIMTPCPAGKYLNAYFGKLLTDCKECIPGYECPTAGITTPTILCPAGKVCDAGTTTSTTDCPIGHKCPTGSEMPLKCEAGTY
jgi:hypothetical protein